MNSPKFSLVCGKRRFFFCFFVGRGFTSAGRHILVRVLGDSCLPFFLRVLGRVWSGGRRRFLGVWIESRRAFSGVFSFQRWNVSCRGRLSTPSCVYAFFGEPRAFLPLRHGAWPHFSTDRAIVGVFSFPWEPYRIGPFSLGGVRSELPFLQFLRVSFFFPLSGEVLVNPPPSLQRWRPPRPFPEQFGAPPPFFFSTSLFRFLAVNNSLALRLPVPLTFVSPFFRNPAFRRLLLPFLIFNGRLGLAVDFFLYCEAIGRARPPLRRTPRHTEGPPLSHFLHSKPVVRVP